jgi:hypothetical protein
LRFSGFRSRTLLSADLLVSDWCHLRTRRM